MIKKTIVSCGRLTKQKRFDVLIDAFALFHKNNLDFSLEIYGEGELHSVLQKQIDNLGLLFQVLDELMIGKPLVIIIIKLIRSAVFYAPGAMWFVGACIVSCLLLEKMEQNNLFNQESIEQVLLLSLLLFAFALICNTYYFLIINTPLKKVVDVYLLIAISARNGLFLFIFPLIGFLMGYTGYGTFRSQKKSIAIISCLIGFTLLIIEVTVVYGQKTRDDSSLFLALILIIPSIVSVALSCNHAFITTKNEIVWKKFRKHSVVLFFTHSPVLKILLLSGYADYGKVLFVFTFIICTIIFIATEKFGNKTTQKLLGF